MQTGSTPSLHSSTLGTHEEFTVDINASPYLPKVNVRLDSPENIVSTLLDVYQKRGHLNYEEDISQVQHALQSATLAERSGASAKLISAALLHDIGHLLVTEAEENAGNMNHELKGYNILQIFFDEEITLPIQLHVTAKRCLVALESGYYEKLSEASKISLKKQGGPFSKEEAAEFQKQKCGEDALKLRRWDDLAKDPLAQTPDLEYFGKYILKSLKAQ